MTSKQKQQPRIEMKEMYIEIANMIANFHNEDKATMGSLYLEEARRQVREYGPSKYMRPDDWCYDVLKIEEKYIRASH